MHDILRLADREGLHVVEDAAQAHGARIAGRRVGTLGAIGCFSFHPSKNLAAAGDGGALVTSDPELAEQIGVLRSLGQRRQNEHVRVGPNTRLHTLEAIVLREKLPYLDDWNEARSRIASVYREGLADCPVSFQEPGLDGEHVFHLFQLRTSERDGLLRHLQDARIDAVIRYPTPIHLQPAFAELGLSRGAFPVAEALAAELLCLPIRPNLAASEIERVISVTRGFFGMP
jgi:dTDP-4-amino-4,6-dideoxygalactose transaminase